MPSSRRPHPELDPALIPFVIIPKGGEQRARDRENLGENCQGLARNTRPTMNCAMKAKIKSGCQELQLARGSLSRSSIVCSNSGY